MRRLFTFFAAALFAVSMFAQTTERNPLPADVTADQARVGTSYTIPAAQVAGGGSKLVGDMWDKGVKVRMNKKHGEISNALPFLVNEGKQINRIKIVGISNADTDLNCTSVIVDGATQSLTATLPNKNSTSSGEVEVTGLNALESVIFISSGASQALICYEITYDDATPSTDPVLNVSMDTIDIHLTAAIPNEMHTVTFSGKNLTPGTYALNVPNLAGLNVNPTSVTVGADGKLNAEVALTYTSQVNVAAGVAAVSLSIDNLSAQVVIRYSADLTINYATSVNIEQWVLDNGKNDAAFHAVLSAAHIDFENINELDSLSDKDHRNYPYLGLKLKAAGANMGCWLQQGSSIKVRLGNVGDPILVAVNGQTSEMTAADLQNNEPEDDKVLSFPADGSQVTADTYVQIITKSSKTVVIKQIMINEDIAAVVLPVQTAIDNTLAAPKATKRILNGQVVIEKNGKFYDLLGTELR